MRNGSIREYVVAAGAALVACGTDSRGVAEYERDRRASPELRVNAPSAATAAAPSATTIEVRWKDNSTNESGFQVYRSTAGPTGVFSLRGTTGTNVAQFTDTGLTSATQYCYRVAAVAKGTTSGFSNTACATTAAPPATPANATATPTGSTVVSVSWTDVSGDEAGFAVEVAASATGPWQQIATTVANVTSVVDAARLPEVLVCYRVTAFNANGASAPSNAACTTPPAAPAALAAFARDPTSASVTWTDTSAVESGYEVQRSNTQSGPFQVVATVAANSTGFVDVGLTTNAIYWYRVRALKDGGFSDFSGVVSVLIANGAPAAPTSLAAMDYGNPEIDLTWVDNSTNEDGFRVESAASPNGPWDQSFIVATPYVGLSNAAPPDQPRCFRVFAFNARGDSAPSNVVCAAVPHAPTGLATAGLGTQAIDLAWTDNSSVEDAYEVSRSTSAGGPWVMIATLSPNTTTYRDSAVFPDQPYVYVVRARTGQLHSVATNTVVGIAASAPPDVPTVTVEATGSSVAYVTWSAARASGFRVDRSTDDGATWTSVPTATGPDNWMYDPDRPTEQQVCYRVAAFNSVGESAPSSPACTIPPAAPLNVAAMVVDSKVTLTWIDASAVETGYKITRMFPYQLEPFFPIAFTPPDATSFDDFADATSWNSDVAWYEITAVTANGVSDSVGVYVQIAPLAPMFLTATPASSTQIDLSWLNTGYAEHTVRIERCTGDATACPDAAFATIVELLPFAALYSDAALQPGTTYTYRVRFFNAAGVGPPASVSATTPL